MKRLLLIFVSVLLGFYQVYATILTGSCGENATFVINDDSTFVIKGSGDMSNYNNSIPCPWYSARAKIKSVQISNGITSVGSNSFSNCPNIVSVKLPDSITKIGDGAFYSCGSLQSIELPNSLLTIGSIAFRRCANLKSIIISDNVVSVGSSAFEECKNLETVAIGNSVSELGSNVFEDCYAIKSVTIGKSLEDLGTAFNSYANVSELTYAEGCTKTIKTRFSAISVLNLPNSLLEICDDSFNGFKRITNVKLPDKLSRIGNNAFKDCLELTAVIFPATLTFVGKEAFYNCKKLSSIAIPGGIREIKEGTFGLCKSLSKVTIFEGVEKIGDKAFYNCSSLESIKFPSSLKNIGEGAFIDCGHIVDINLENNIAEIGTDAFMRCSSIVRLTLPSSLKVIGANAFYKCSSLSEVSFANGIQIIGIRAFYDCDKITSLKLPNSVNSVGEEAFAGTNKIFSEVIIGNGLEELSHAFGVSRIYKLVIGNKISTINESTSVFGSSYSGNPEHVQSYLLTNNIVKFKSLTTYGPDCEFFVADASKYSNEEVKRYGIKNIISTSTYSGEYSGTAPNINFYSNLNDYDTKISKKYYEVGTYTTMEVEFSKGDFSSTITVPCNYTITKAPLVITPYDVSITYGEDIPDFNCYYRGLKNEETPSQALSSLPSISTIAKKGSDAGEYKLYAGGAEAKNYSIAYQTGILKIIPAQQSITWNQNFDGTTSNSKIELCATSNSGLPIQYISSDPSIAYIVAEGDKTYLYTRKDGTVVISASQMGNNNYVAATSVNKTISILPMSATGISLDFINLEMIVGEMASLQAFVAPETVLNKMVVWSSSNASIASVDQNGTVKASSIGEAVITATTVDGSNLSASCKVTVMPIVAKSITLDSETVEVNVGDNTTLKVIIKPDNATYKTVNWTSSDENVATVTDGVVVGKKPGTTIISAITVDGSELRTSCIVKVLDVLATMLSLEQESIDLYVGERATVKAVVYPNNATNNAVAWTTSNASVVIVEDGVITAKSEGTALITVKTTDESNLSAICQVTVKRHPQTIIWNQDLSAVVSGGELIKLEATSSSGLDVTFSSSDDNIASIFVLSDGAYLNAYGMGAVNIIASQGGDNHYAPSSQLKVVNVVASSGITDVYSDEHFTIYTLKGVKVGIFTADEYKELRLAKGIYIVNGRKIVVK